LIPFTFTNRYVVDRGYAVKIIDKLVDEHFDGGSDLTAALSSPKLQTAKYDFGLLFSDGFSTVHSAVRKNNTFKKLKGKAQVKSTWLLFVLFLRFYSPDT